MRVGASVLLFGLEEALATELEGVLAALGQSVLCEPTASGSRLREHGCVDLVFCPAAPDGIKSLLEAIERWKPGTPVVAVSRQPEISLWLDALEAGASDYCSAPFERAQVGWILESRLGNQHFVTA